MSQMRNEGFVARMTICPGVYPDEVEVSATDDGVWRLAAALSGAVTPLDVATALAEEGAAAAGTSYSNLAILDAATDQVRAIHHSSAGSDIVARWTEFHLDTPTPLCEAMQSGLPVLLESLDVIGTRFPNIRADTLAAGLSATASLPLADGNGVILGAAGFGWMARRTRLRY